MNLLRYNTKLAPTACGAITLENSYKELERILSRGGEVFNNESIAIPATHFTLARSDRDFLEVSCHSVDQVHFASNRIVYNIPFFKKPFADSRLQFRTNSRTSKQVVADYFDLSRKLFEDKYSAGYVDKRSLVYHRVESLAEN